MSEERWYCDCSGFDAFACTSADTLLDRNPDGSCDCGCHGTYSDDPENWQRLCLINPRKLTDAEIADGEDWVARIEAAEALIEETE